MKTALLIIGLTFILFNRLSAQPGALDPTFGTGGKVIDSTGEIAYGVAIQDDHKLVVCGAHLILSGQRYVGILTRYNEDGTPDQGFNSSVAPIIDTSQSFDFTDVLIQPDGKIIAAGRSGLRYLLKRYLPDGSADLSFNGNGEVIKGFLEGGYISTVLLQPDNKILVAGQANNEPSVTRFHSDGSIDSTFGSDGTVTIPIDMGNGIFSGIVLQADGKLVAAGYHYYAETEEDQSNLLIARFLPGGTLDESFAGTGSLETPGGSSEFLESVAIQPDGKIIVSGERNNVPTKENGLLGRYNSDGTPDLSFAGVGLAEIIIPGSFLYLGKILLQPNGKIIVTGRLSSDRQGHGGDFLIMRYLPDGYLDSLFGTNGMTTTSFSDSSDMIVDAVLQADGKIVVAGGTEYQQNSYHFGIARYQGDEDAGVKIVQKDKLNLYPNPTSGKMVLQTDGTLTGESFILTDASGRMIQTGTIPETEQILDLSGFQPGMYFFHAGNQQLPIVKQ